MYYNARYYDPEIGQFISPDSIVPDPTNVFAYNRYMYVYGNPLKYSDPTGHCPICVIFVLAVVGLCVEGSVSSGPAGSYVDTPSNANGQMAVSIIAGDVNDLAIVATGYDYILMEPVPYGSEEWGDAAVMVALPVASRSSAKLVGSVVQDTNPVRKNLDNVWHGSGPVPGVIGVNKHSKSVGTLKNYYPKEGGIEFVFDPQSNTFAVGKPITSLNGSPHQQLATSIGADPDIVVGGMFSRGPNGQIVTNEHSGHYWKNWTAEVREQFIRTMDDYGVPILHSDGM